MTGCMLNTPMFIINKYMNGKKGEKKIHAMYKKGAADISSPQGIPTKRR